MNNKNGGPAFPLDADLTTSESISILDYFAGKAMAGMLAYPGDERSGSWHSNATPKSISMQAYSIAAEMLAEKKRRETT